MIGGLIVKLIANTISATETGWNTAAAAAASVAESLLLACRSTLAVDFHRIKEANLKRLEAKAQSGEAEAQKKLAEAASAANKVTRRLHADALAKLEIESRKLDNLRKGAALKQAEAKARIACAQADQATLRTFQEGVNTIAILRKRSFDAKEQALFDSLAKLQREGGQLYVDFEQLKKLQSPPTQQPSGMDTK